MPSVNELLLDAAVDHAVDLSAYSNHVIRRMLNLLNRVDADLAAALASALDRLPTESFTVERLESLLGAVRRLNAQAYKAIDRELRNVLREFAQVEAAYQGDLFERVVPQQVQVRFRIARVAHEQVYAAAMSRPFQGRLLRDWARKMEADRMDIIRNAVRIGYVQGETVSQIVTRLRGTRASAYADGAINRSRRDLEAVVDTAVKHTAAVARDRMLDANEDIVKAIRWASTLDTRTSEWCVIRDGLKYTIKGHKPIGHKVPWLGGPGKIHFRCRSVGVPVLKSWRELGIDADDLPASTRASMDGQVPADLPFGDWLKRQTTYRQEQVLGPTRAKLMRQGGLDLPALFSPTGLRLSLDQLRERNAAAFERAGL